MGTREPKKAQRIEYCDGEVQELHCPFCGQLVKPAEGEMEFTPCAHTLFIAHDEGIEYRSPLFDLRMDIEGVDPDDLDLGEESIDSWTDTFPDALAIKFAFYAPSPSFMGTYVAFHPYAQPPAGVE